MHVLMTVDPLGGVFTYAAELSAWLGSKGARVTWASMGGPLSAEQRRRIGSRDVLESEFRLEWMDDPWEDVERAGPWLLDIERREKPDVVHLNGYAHAALPFRAPVLVVAHSCVLSWWRAVLGEAAPPRYDRYRQEVSQGLGAASVVVAPTRAMLASLQLEYGGSYPSRVIHNGAAARTSDFHKESFVLCAGRIWDRAKNIATIDRAAARVRWPVYVAGDAKAPDVRQETPLDNVRPLGILQSSMLASWMRRAAIFASPALYEPFGLAILEAGLAGCALVLGDIPSLRELWHDHALFVPPRDDEALARALQRLIDDPALRRELGKRAQERALEYGSQAMGEAYLDLYDTLSRRENAPLAMELC